jgi:hypothetical protein
VRQELSPDLDPERLAFCSVRAPLSALKQARDLPVLFGEQPEYSRQAL